MRRAVIAVLALLQLAVSPPPVRADNMRWVEGQSTTSAVTVTTTSETVALSSNQALVTTSSVRVLVIGWCQLTTGTSTTFVTPRLRRGTATTGTLIGAATAETPAGAAGTTAHYLVIASDTQSGVDNVQYSLTVQQTAASANGSIVSSGILVIVFS